MTSANPAKTTIRVRLANEKRRRAMSQPWPKPAHRASGRPDAPAFPARREAPRRPSDQGRPRHCIGATTSLPEGVEFAVAVDEIVVGRVPHIPVHALQTPLLAKGAKVVAHCGDGSRALAFFGRGAVAAEAPLGEPIGLAGALRENMIVQILASCGRRRFVVARHLRRIAVDAVAVDEIIEAVSAKKGVGDRNADAVELVVGLPFAAGNRGHAGGNDRRMRVELGMSARLLEEGEDLQVFDEACGDLFADRVLGELAKREGLSRPGMGKSPLKSTQLISSPSSTPASVTP